MYHEDNTEEQLVGIILLVTLNGLPLVAGNGVVHDSIRIHDVAEKYTSVLIEHMSGVVRQS